MNNDIIYPHVIFMQIDTEKTVEMYDVTEITFDDNNSQVYAKGKTNFNGTNKIIEMYNTRIVYKEEDDLQ